jgi:hypothetical protein
MISIQFFDIEEQFRVTVLIHSHLKEFLESRNVLSIRKLSSLTDLGHGVVPRSQSIYLVIRIGVSHDHIIVRGVIHITLTSIDTGIDAILETRDGIIRETGLRGTTSVSDDYIVRGQRFKASVVYLLRGLRYLGPVRLGWQFLALAAQ